jgi:hypothetical protein
MALPSNGPISMSQINSEFGRSSNTLITLSSASTGIYGAIKIYSALKPDGVAPHRISEFYSYNHSATAPSITITNYSAGNLYFTLAGTGYSTSALTVKSSTTSSSGPWSSNTSGTTSPRVVTVPTQTTWYQIEDAITPSIVSNVYQYVISDTTPPPIPVLTGSFNNSTRALILSWTAVTDPSSPVKYNLYRNNVYQGTSTLTYNNLYGASIPSGNNSWTIRSVDNAGNISANSNAISFVAT